jgi:hypothetical protein
MDDTLCRRFFSEPQNSNHRHYEIVRAHFVDNQPLQQIADRFELSYYTVRDLVRAFRRAEQPPPFLPSRDADDHHETTCPRNILAPRLLPSPTAAP